MTQTELNEIIRLHEAWLAGKERGIRASLAGQRLRKKEMSHANLRDVDLSGADLRGSRLIGSILVGADLTCARFSGSCMRGADLSKARIVGTLFDGADMKGVKMDEAVMFSAEMIEKVLNVTLTPHDMPRLNALHKDVTDGTAAAGTVIEQKLNASLKVADKAVNLAIFDLTNEIRRKETELHQLRVKLAKLKGKPLRKRKSPRIQTPEGTLKVKLGQFIRFRSACFVQKVLEAGEEYRAVTSKSPDAIIEGVLESAFKRTGMPAEEIRKKSMHEKIMALSDSFGREQKADNRVLVSDSRLEPASTYKQDLGALRKQAGQNSDLICLNSA